MGSCLEGEVSQGNCFAAATSFRVRWFKIKPPQLEGFSMQLLRDTPQRSELTKRFVALSERNRPSELNRSKARLSYTSPHLRVPLSPPDLTVKFTFATALWLAIAPSSMLTNTGPTERESMTMRLFQAVVVLCCARNVCGVTPNQRLNARWKGAGSE